MFRPTPGMVIHCIVIPCCVARIWASLHPFPIGQRGNTLWAHWAYCTITWCIHAFLRWVEGCCHASHTTGIVWIVAVQQPHGVHACNQNQCTMHLLWQNQACNTQMSSGDYVYCHINLIWQSSIINYKFKTLSSLNLIMAM